MKMVAVGLAILLSACASSTSSPSTVAEQQNTKQKDVICIEGQALGSHMKSRRCVSKEQAAAEREAAQKELRDKSMSSHQGGN